LPEQLPNDADGFKALVVELQAFEGADDVLSKLPTAALGGNTLWALPQCEREQYQRPEACGQSILSAEIFKRARKWLQLFVAR